MNNTQLDMVLNYLNEGVEINSNEFFIESINEFYEQSIYESIQFVNFLESNEEDKDSNSILEKIKESIKKFINWIKTLITKLKLKIKQMSVNILSKILEKNIAKQKEAAKDADLDAKITFSSMEHLMLFHGNELIDMDEDKIFEVYEIINKSDKELTKEDNNDGLIYKTLKRFGKVSLPILAISTKLSDLVMDAILKAHGKEESDKEKRTITVKEYLDHLDQIKDAGLNAKNTLDDALKSYDDMIEFANALYKTDLKSGNLALNTATKATKFIIDITSAALKCITYATAISGKHIKKLKKKTEEK